MIFVVLIMLAIPAGIAAAAVWCFSSCGKPPQITRPPRIPRNSQAGASGVAIAKPPGCAPAT